jgi:hypothetical protein
VRNEVPELLNFIVNLDHPEQSKLPELINLALTKESDNHRLRRNAAAILSDPSRQLQSRLQKFPTEDEPLIYTRLIQFPQTKWADDFEVAGQYAKIFASVNRQDQHNLLDRVPNFAEVLFRRFHVNAYQELYCSLLEDEAEHFFTNSPAAITGLVELAKESAKAPTTEQNYQALYNIYGSLHALAQNGSEAISPFRKQNIFVGLLRAVVQVGRHAITLLEKSSTENEARLFELVSYAFRGLQLLYYQVNSDDEGSNGMPPCETVFPGLEPVVMEVSKEFSFVEQASKPIMDIQMAMFPLLYHVAMQPMMNQFFKKGASPLFCRYYLASLARIPESQAVDLIKRGLPQLVLKKFGADEKGKIQYLPKSFFTFQMAETLIDPDKLTLGSDLIDGNWPLKETRWIRFATRVVLQMHFLKQKLANSRRDPSSSHS